jgi:hypothetical protein
LDARGLSQRITSSHSPKNMLTVLFQFENSGSPGGNLLLIEFETVDEVGAGDEGSEGKNVEGKDSGHSLP